MQINFSEGRAVLRLCIMRMNRLWFGDCSVISQALSLCALLSLALGGSLDAIGFTVPLFFDPDAPHQKTSSHMDDVADTRNQMTMVGSSTSLPPTLVLTSMP